LVKDNAQLECVRNKRPMGVLKEVTFPA
jgi:ATP adenylyltransferase/5',5'''-P-1,P-4-tetraphosphate phosphorylase II